MIYLIMQVEQLSFAKEFKKEFDKEEIYFIRCDYMKKIVIIGFNNDGHIIFSNLENKESNIKTLLYYDKYHEQDLITDYKYFWGI